MSGERKIGVALDYSASSRYALKWAIDNCVRPRDHLIVLVVNRDQANQLQASGSQFIPLAAALDPRNQLTYQLNLDEDLANALLKATAKSVIMQPLLLIRAPPQIG